MGYDAEWGSITASAFGAPHKRERVFIISYPASGGWGKYKADQRGYNTQIKKKWKNGDKVIRMVNVPRYLSAQSESSSWQVKPGMGRVVNGLPRRLDRLKQLGNAVVPQIAQFIGNLIIEAEARNERN